MSDIIDYIRARLAERQPALLPVVDSVLLDARWEYGGERHYVRFPKKSRRIVATDTRRIAIENGVCRRTAQRWLK